MQADRMRRTMTSCLSSLRGTLAARTMVANTKRVEILANIANAWIIRDYECEVNATVGIPASCCVLIYRALRNAVRQVHGVHIPRIHTRSPTPPPKDSLKGGYFACVSP
ncbi:hypothetical protein FIBSPDRAFT_36947 [Athelia psychrophila]|uniref:Uncharacterized protein n=1 Tax=Athelia psychrophila TaxID=1759441 RepID=A0A166FN71_9AGAM|nr:hypothetical protein FIBSPDRAFT_36947 [Fibularhizoctonia sp. CBS 109695]